jgi:hypothetical protein
MAVTPWSTARGEVLREQVLTEAVGGVVRAGVSVHIGQSRHDPALGDQVSVDRGIGPPYTAFGAQVDLFAGREAPAADADHSSLYSRSA